MFLERLPQRLRHVLHQRADVALSSYPLRRDLAPRDTQLRSQRAQLICHAPAFRMVPGLAPFGHPQPALDHAGLVPLLDLTFA
uniref:Uncharacterized protein n=1 Tax=uncultured marine virus TaxID=186617 RepID=A0A0F7L5E4_9VIRU|nr:hypothetical protein [uncultured marine virus]